MTGPERALAASPGDGRALSDAIFFDDIVLGEALTTEAYALSAEEIIAFAERWDPMPIHVDQRAAEASMFGGLTAAGCHLLAIKQKLVHRLPLQASVICTMGFDEVRFHAPGRPGDRLRLRLTWREKRVSQSKPDCGVVKHFFELLNAEERVLLSHFDTVLMRMRPVGLSARLEGSPA